MRCPSRFRGSFVVAVCLSIAALSQAACSSADNAEAGAVGTTSTGGSDPFVITFSQTYVTIENRSGVPISEGEMVIVPRGVMAPFRTSLPRIENSQRRDVMLNMFRSVDGTPFRRGVARTRTLRISATDITGKKLEQELPFE